MLKNIDPLLTPELLYVLASMGHGDELAVVDANFPADSLARDTPHGRAITLVGASMPATVRAVLSLLPLDDYVDMAVRTMADKAAATQLAPVQQEVQAIVDEAAGCPWPMGMLDRLAFYDAARQCYAIVLTAERRLYGNVLIKKGVVPPEG